MIKNIGMGTGRRKTAIARVFLREGTGKLQVNDKEISAYFVTPEQVQTVRQPLMVTASDTKFDILITVMGGGLNGQAGACRHGIALLPRLTLTIVLRLRRMVC